MGCLSCTALCLFTYGVHPVNFGAVASRCASSPSKNYCFLLVAVLAPLQQEPKKKTKYCYFNLVIVGC